MKTNACWMSTLALIVCLSQAPRLVQSVRAAEDAELDKAIATMQEDAAVIREKAAREIAAIRAKAKRDLEARVQAHMEKLKALADAHAQAGETEKAAAVRAAIVLVKAMANPLPDPGNLEEFRGKENEVLVFEVVGAAQGEVWGTDVYTDDSSLAAAAVHAGVLADGERGLVRVTILPGQNSYQGTERNGLASDDWDAWEGSFRVEKALASPKPKPARK